MESKLRFRQRYTGHGIGGLLDTYQRTAGILMIAQYIALIIILYTTSLRPFFDAYLPWMTFGVYIIIAFVVVIVVMIMAYIIVAPSHYAFWNQQIWKHDNPMRTKLEDIEKKLDEVNKQLEALRKSE